MRSSTWFPLLPVLFLATWTPTRAQVIFPTSPDWQSSPPLSSHQYSTGGVLVDLDRDGWLDFVVADGNDIRREHLVVYYNNGDGTYPTTPNWSSFDNEYNGHLNVADVNGDGWLDVAVALTMDGDGTSTARLYLNNAGTLSPTPDWTSAHALAGFHVSFGDVNADGRPDLAVGTGFPYHGSHRWRNYIYFNVDGALEPLPSWQSQDTYDYMDLFFHDVNYDGMLDLIAVGTNTSTRVYLNQAGVLDVAASWNTTDNYGQFSIMGTYGDVDADGLRDLFVTDNTQLLQGSGYCRRYDAQPGGFFTAIPTWSYYDNYGSAVALADVDADGDLDLTTGAWFSYPKCFLNDEGTYPATPEWTSAQYCVVEALCFGDVDNDGLRYQTEWFDAADQHLFYLAHQPIQWLEWVNVDGVMLSPDLFTYDLVHGWVSVGPAPSEFVAVRYAYSHKPDLAVTNWGSSYANHLYYNRNDTPRFGDFNDDDTVDLSDLTEFTACMTGPGPGLVDPPASSACRAAFDTEGDGDIDHADWAEFMLVFGS